MQTKQRQPLILTLKLDTENQAFFDLQRGLYFPPERNFLEAHLTLFHQLPDEPYTHEILNQLTFRPIEIQVTGLINSGTGVAYRLESRELHYLQASLSHQFNEVLIPQDRQPFRPHITIQNKVRPESARELIKHLSTDFKAFTIRGIGLQLWRYLNGPWEPVKVF